MWLLKVICLLVVAFQSVSGYGEPDANGLPQWYDRSTHYVVNAVRIAPIQYKSLYMAGYNLDVSGILVNYPAVPPIYLEVRLCESANNHSVEMAQKNYFQHNSYDNTVWSTRIGYFYSCKGAPLGENIAAGHGDPIDTNNQFLCDSVGSSCAADHSANDGHRSNIMSSNYRSAGFGYGYSSSSTYKYYWTQDFGGNCAGSGSIYSGSHFISGSTIKFVSIYYASDAPTSASVVVGGQSYPLSVEIGSANNGGYAYSTNTTKGCRPYYFTFTSGTNTTRYPTTGCLSTFGEGGCASHFDATCGGTVTTTSKTSSDASSTFSSLFLSFLLMTFIQMLI